MILFTLPDEKGTPVPWNSVRGFSHLLIVASLLLVLIVCATAMVLADKEIPQFFQLMGASGFAYIIGVNAGAKQ